MAELLDRERELMEPRVFVYHSLLVRFGRLDSGEHSLGGVTYTYAVPADTEFGEFGSTAPGRFALFLRLLGRDAGSTQLLVCCHFRNRHREWIEMARFPMTHAIAFPEEGEVVQDTVINLPFLRIGGVGVHAITVHLRAADASDFDELDGVEEPAWMADDEWMEEPGWSHGSTEYFEIVRAT